MHVQFTDSKETAILAVFGCPQDATVYPNQGEIETSDARYAAYYEALPAIAQSSMPTPTSTT